MLGYTVFAQVAHHHRIVILPLDRVLLCALYCSIFGTHKYTLHFRVIVDKPQYVNW